MNITALHTFYEQNGELSMQPERINLIVMNALNFLIHHVLGNIANPLTITISTVQGLEEFWFQDMIGKFLIAYGLTAVQLIVHDSRRTKVRVYGRRYNNLLLVDSFETLRDAKLNEHNRYYDSMEYYFIFLQIRDKFMYQERAKILQYCFDNYWLHCSVMTQNARGEVLIHTYFPFRKNKCFQTEAILINQFKDGNFTHSEMFPNKVKNLNGCPLKLTTWHVPPFVIKKPNQTIEDVKGLEIVILKTLSEEMNFTLELDVESDVMCPTEALDVLINRRTNISAGYFRSTAHRDAAATSSYFLYHLPLMPLMLKRQSQFESLDILTYPFDKYSWLLLIVSCISLILLNSIRSRSERSFNRWHVIESMLGYPTLYVPKRLTLRTSFIVWILATFILRCLYHSLLFYLYRIHFYKRPLETMADLLQSNFEAVCTESSEPFAQNALNNIESSLPLTVLNTTNEMIPFYYLIQHPDKNIVALTTEEFIYYFAGFEMVNRPGLSSTEEIWTNQQIRFYFPKHSYLMERFNEYILRLHQSQLLLKWRKDIITTSHVRKSTVTTVYEKELMINMNQVMGFIKVILVLYSIALITFIMELLSKWIQFVQVAF